MEILLNYCFGGFETFTSLPSAQRAAQKLMGKSPILFPTMATSDDMIITLQIDGCKPAALFPLGHPAPITPKRRTRR
jgi:hypothetical protein